MTWIDRTFVQSLTTNLSAFNKIHSSRIRAPGGSITLTETPTNIKHVYPDENCYNYDQLADVTDEEGDNDVTRKLIE